MNEKRAEGMSLIHTFCPCRARSSSSMERYRMRGAFFTGSPDAVLKLFWSHLGIQCRKPVKGEYVLLACKTGSTHS